MKALSVAWKDISIFLKDRGSVVQLFLLPLLFIVVLSGALGAIGQRGPADTRILLPVVDLDGGQAAQTLLKGLETAGGVRLKHYEQAEALDLLAKAELQRVLIIPTGFSSGLAEQRQSTLRLVNQPSASAAQTEAVRLVIDGVARDMALEVEILASLEQMGEMMADAPPEYQEALSVERSQAQARKQFESSRMSPLVTVKQSVPRTADEAQSPEITPDAGNLAVPGFAVLFVFLAAQATALSIFAEKKSGSFRRLLAAPIAKLSLLIGKVLPNFLTALVQMVVIFAFGSFGLRLLGLPPASLGKDPLALLLAVVLIALCSSALGLVIAAIARTESQASGLSSLMLWVMGIVGGCIIPLFALEMFLGPVPKIVPHYWANRLLDNLMIRGLGMAEVTTEMAALLGFTVLFFVIGMWRFEFE